MLLICPQTLLPICTSNNNSRTVPHNARPALRTTESLSRGTGLRRKILADQRRQSRARFRPWRHRREL